jgi:RNA recognition motif-containing protein
MKLFVAGLPYDLDDAELEEIFEKFGTITSARVAIDRETGKSKGFGFVEMENDEEAKEAIENLKDISLGKKPLVVTQAEDRSSSRPPNRGEIKPITSGVYEVTKYAVNKDTLAPLISDTLRWQDVIFEKGGMGSVKTNDTIFRRRYGRGYFVFTADSVKQIINFKKFQEDSISILTLHYQLPDSNTIQLSGKKQNDSLYVELKKSKRHFQLAEKQFHWLSEANR